MPMLVSVWKQEGETSGSVGWAGGLATSRERGRGVPMSIVTTGMLNDEIPYLAFGDGPPLVMAMGLTATHEVPTGWERRMVLRNAMPLSADFRVYVVNQKPGLRLGESMSEIAGYLIAAVEEEFGEPVLLTGTSTGGSVALQLAVDRPDLVRALVVVASAYRLGPRGRELQRELARLTRAGDAAGGWAQLMTAMLPTPLQRPTQPLIRRMVGSMAPDDATDMLGTIDAEDAFDVGEQLHRICAPTLVIGGGKDAFYPRELFEQTAAGVQNGRAHIYPDWGHMRTSSSSTTRNISLGFLLAALRNTVV
jgi:pimeloyl-ACP methyl ester carboxylesterase